MKTNHLMIENRLHALLRLWQSVLRLLGRSAPSLSIAVSIVTLLEAISGLLVLYSIKLLVDAISASFATQPVTLSGDVLYTLCFAGASFLMASALFSVGEILRMRQGLVVSDFVDREIHNRAISVGLKYYESPEYYDALERAREGGSRRPAQIVGNSIIVFRAFVTILGVLFLIGSIEYKLLPALLVPVLIALLIRLHFARKLFDWRMSRAQLERRASYFDFVITHSTHAKDVRINGLGEHFRDKYSNIKKDLRSKEIKIEQARLASDFGTVVIGIFIFLGATTWLLFQSLEGVRPIGDVVLAVLLLRRAETSGNQLVGNVTNIVDDHLYLSRLFDFLSVPLQKSICDKPTVVPDRLSSRIALSNVSFRYEGADTHALKSVSLTLEPGQVVAIVGENGSGKSTLIKLLARLYDPTEGSISWDGRDIREFKPEEYRKLVSAVFQDHIAYAESVAENIRLGNIERVGGSISDIENAARNAGAMRFIESLPSGLDTPLTKLFDNGHDLSIGQWQRLALARALYAQSHLLILDEPTSAMDPKAEFELFEHFKSRISGRTTLIVSHRLTTIRQADYIYVLSGSRLAEEGTHEELIDGGGVYEDMFKKQSHHDQ